MSIIDTSGYVSEFTKNTLEQFGWQKGDPLLDTMGEIIQQIRERTPATTKAGVLIDIDLMSEQDVGLMRATLLAAKQAQVTEKKQQEFREELDSLSPAVQDVYAKLVAANAQQDDGVAIVDDRSTAPQPQEQPAPTVEEKKPEIPEPKKPDLGPETGIRQPDELAPITPAFCPRCEWDLRQQYETEITPEDKENFLATILGGTRYKKDYSMLNGKYTVIFRTLLSEENKLIHRQLMLERKAGEFLSDTEWFLKFFEYRLACSVDSVIVKGEVTAVVPTLDELGSQPLPVKNDDPTLPPLMRLHAYVLKDVFSAEITRRIVGKHFREFQRMYEALEAMALEPSFW